MSAPRGGPRCRPRGERGAVTAEVAVAVPALVATTVLLMAVQTLGLQQVTCLEAADAAARALARGEDIASASARARALTPGARVGPVTTGPGGVVGVRVRLPGWPTGTTRPAGLPVVTCRALAYREEP